MDILLYTKYIVVLILVLGLIFLISYVVRKLGFVPGVENSTSRKSRLALTATTAIDAKRRLVLVRRDDQEHLILLGPDGDTVVETNIPIERVKSDAPDQSEESEAGKNETSHVEPVLPTFGKAGFLKRKEE